MQRSLQRVIHMSTAQLITYLDLAAHPEGGWYRETWRVGGESGDRPIATAVYYLLVHGERRHWHRSDCSSLWVYHAGAPVCVSIAETDTGPATDALLGPELASAHMPQCEVKSNHWQAAVSTGDWTLCSIISSPGFQCRHFEIAPSDFDVPRE